MNLLTKMQTRTRLKIVVGVGIDNVYFEHRANIRLFIANYRNYVRKLFIFHSLLLSKPMKMWSMLLLMFVLSRTIADIFNILQHLHNAGMKNSF